MKHFENLQQSDLWKIPVGEEFTYKVVTFEGKVLYRKGIKVTYAYMIPVGLHCRTIESARIQN